jgi:hypothetical protein
MSVISSDPRSAIAGVQLLPFIIKPATSKEEMDAVRKLRFAAYSRHGYPPDYCDLVLLPDARELNAVTTSLVAFDKETGEAICTLRLTSNLDGPVPLGPTMPPDPMFDEPFVWLDRFAVVNGPGGALVSLAMMKAAWLWTAARGARWMAAGARKAMARRYEMAGLCRREIAPEGYRIAVFPEEPMFLVAATVESAESKVTAKNPAFRAFAAQVHPDIRLW